MSEKGYTIVCPLCKIKQTGIARIAQSKVTIIPDSSDLPRIWKQEAAKEIQNEVIYPGTEYIRCAYLPCQYIMTGSTLEKVTRTQVKYPADMYK